MNASDSRPAHANTAERRSILDAIPAIAWCKLPDGSNEFVNQRWQDYTGIPTDEARGQGWQAAVHPEDLPKLSEKWAEIVASGKSGEFEGRLRRHDGAFRWVLARFEPVRDDTGEIVRWYGTSTDIDALKQAEEKLREDERALRRITDTIPQNIVVLDPDGIPIYANRATLDYTGLALADVVSSDFRARVFHPDDLERVRDQRQAVLAAGVPFEFELRALSKEGQYRWFLTRYKPFHDEQGRLVSWYATGTDIDDRKRAEDRTRNENVALREEIVRSSMFEEIVGSSDALRTVLAQIAKVAPTDSTVLIQGETGTGKELIARAIHSRSRRGSRAFIRVNCAAIPPSLLASELFGHEKGAFTGALQRRLGRFVPRVDFVAMGRRGIQFYRPGKYPPLRGMWVRFDDTAFLFYTMGYVPYLRTYPGASAPQPIEILEHHGDSGWNTMLAEILSLTKMNWNTAAFAAAEPMTLAFARRVGEILAEFPESGPAPRPEYRFYM